MIINFKDGRAVFTKENNKNMIYFFKDNRDYGKATGLPKNFGNYWFKIFKDASTKQNSIEFIMDRFWLDWLAYNEDFDSYSDIHKDIFNVRPHYTMEQWERVIKEAKNRKP